MPKLLFVNACVRGKESRTRVLAQNFLSEYQALHPETVFVERNLMEERIQPQYPEIKAQRDELWEAGRFDAPMFAPARQFAEADKIIIAAPMWDLSFPAILRIYLEAVSVIHILFRYNAEGECVGLAKADKLLLITTRGSDFSKPELAWMESGAHHLKALCSMYGIAHFALLTAEGLDDERNDAEAILKDAIERAKRLARVF